MSTTPVPPTLDYAPPHPPGKSGRRAAVWVGGLFVAALVIVGVLMQRTPSGPPATTVPLSTFADELRAGNVASVRVDGEEASGTFITPRAMNFGGAPNAPVSRFEVDLPPGAGWQFTQWVMEHRSPVTEVAATPGPGLLAGVVLPLVPWLVIFGSIWLFLYRYLRRPAPLGGGPVEVIVVNRPAVPATSPAAVPPPNQQEKE